MKIYNIMLQEIRKINLNNLPVRLQVSGYDIKAILTKSYMLSLGKLVKLEII